jgi:hypothetical protein
VYVAIAYIQTDYNNYLSRGWLHLETGKCNTFDTAIRVQTFYYHAESEPYKARKSSYGNGAPTSSSPCATPISNPTTPSRNIPACISPSSPSDPNRPAGR